jgi:hypothetical protein
VRRAVPHDGVPDLPLVYHYHYPIPGEGFFFSAGRVRAGGVSTIAKAVLTAACKGESGGQNTKVGGSGKGKGKCSGRKGREEGGEV